MNQKETGLKVAELRNKKGLTQEELAAGTNISIRTIQRIEKGEVKARKYTLKILSEALGYDLLSNSNSKDFSGWIIAIHLSNFIPIVLIPLVIWFLKKDENETIHRHGIKVINYQILVVIVNIIFLIFTRTTVHSVNPDEIIEFVRITTTFNFAYWGLNTLFTVTNLIWSATGKEIVYPHFNIVR